MKIGIRLRGAATLLLGASMLSACGGSGTSSASAGTAQTRVQKVKFTIFPAATVSMGVYVADALGFFAKHDVAVQYVSVGTGSSALQVLAAGGTDFALSDPTGVANARKSGSDAVFAAGQFSRFAAEIACQPSMKVNSSYPDSMKSLVGKKIGITSPGSATDFFSRYSLKAAGVDPSSVQLIPIGGVPQLIAAFKAKSVDCITAYQPIQQKIGNAQAVLDWQAGQGPKEFDNYLMNGIVTSKRYADSHATAVKDLALAMKDATTFASDPNNAAEIAQKTLKFFPGLDIATLTKILKDIAGTYTYRVTETQIANAAVVYQAVTGNAYPAKYDDIVAPSARSVIG